METINVMDRKSERGFTLVELAIVMIIIGLLIGGILKGQELVANAEIGATVAQAKAIDAATTTFRDKYDALPGDMRNVATRIANCTGCVDGNGNGRLGGATSLDPTAFPGGEGRTFFPMLSAADLLGGVRNVAANLQWGDLMPAAKVGGGFHAGHSAGGTLGSNTAAPAGHYLALVLNPNAAAANNTINANKAARIDTKLDDGRGNSGSVFDNGNNCSTAGDYDQDNSALICDMLIRFQN